MSNEIILKEDILEKQFLIKPEEKDNKLNYALGFVKSVNDEISDISHRFFRIGFYLDEAFRNRYYEELGFKNISDCAEYYFGFKKTTTYDLMNVFRCFSDSKRTWYMPERWKKYSQSQLSVMALVNYYPLSFRDMVSEYDTVADIKKAKTYWYMIKQGKLSSKLMRDRSVGRIYNNVKEFIEACEKVLRSSDKNDVLVIPENAAKDEEFSEHSEKILPDVVIEKDSGYPENECLDEDDPFFDKVHDYFSDFLIDNCVFPNREQFMHEFVQDFLCKMKNFVNENIVDFIKFLNTEDFTEQYREAHPNLIFNVEE